VKGIEVVKPCHFESDRGRLLHQGHRRAAVWLAVVAVLCACASDSSRAAKSKTPLTSTIENLGMSPQELRIRVRALIRPTLGILEETGDISAQDVDVAEAQRATLHWRIETTTTLLSAMLRNDPLLALSDAWGYAFQVESFLATPEAVAKYGTLAPKGAAAMEQIRGSFFDFARVLPADLSSEVLEARLRTWAERNPIEGHLYRRPSIDSAFAGILATKGKSGAFAALGSLEETTADVMMRMDLYTMYLPRLARWEGELAVGDLTQGTEVNRLMADVQQITRAADRLAAVAEGASDLVARERAAMLDAVRAERLAATYDMRGERKAVLEAIRQERMAALAEAEAIVQRLLDRSSGPLHEAVRTDVEEILRDGGVTMEGVVDHAFLRAVQLLLIAATLAALGVILYARFLRPR
jgi:hypothetical protein